MFRSTATFLRFYANLATKMSEKALAQGSMCPPLEKNKLRLYSMRFCPFAQRTRLVLAHKRIPHEVVNVNLQYKPDWFLERNPVGLVPILECDGKVVYESSACDQYLDDIYPQEKLTPEDAYEKARQNMLMDVFSQVIGAFATQYRPRFTEEQRVKGRKKLRFLLNIYEKNLSGKYFGGENPSMLDMHIWPWFERLGIIEEINPGNEILTEQSFPKLYQYVRRMFELPAVKETMFPTNMHAKFIMSLMQRNPQYDIGLLESANL